MSASPFKRIAREGVGEQTFLTGDGIVPSIGRISALVRCRSFGKGLDAGSDRGGVRLVKPIDFATRSGEK
jgi:hypothetical protein